LILRKISKTGATRCQILRLKCTKFDSPDPLAVFKGSTSEETEERVRDREGKGKEMVREGRVAPPIPPNWRVWIRQCI